MYMYDTNRINFSLSKTCQKRFTFRKNTKTKYVELSVQISKTFLDSEFAQFDQLFAPKFLAPFESHPGQVGDRLFPEFGVRRSLDYLVLGRLQSFGTYWSSFLWTFPVKTFIYSQLSHFYALIRVRTASITCRGMLWKLLLQNSWQIFYISKSKKLSWYQKKAKNCQYLVHSPAYLYVSLYRIRGT